MDTTDRYPCEPQKIPDPVVDGPDNDGPDVGGPEVRGANVEVLC